MIEEVTFDDEKEYEIVKGQTKEKIISEARHSGIRERLIVRLGSFVAAHNLGGVYGADAKFGQNQRLPGVWVVAAARVPPEGEPEEIGEIAPDLAVETSSPNDIHLKVLSEMRDHFAGGGRHVWIVSPEHKLATVHLSPTDARILSEAGELTCAEIRHGCRLPLKELFKTPAHR